MGRYLSRLAVHLLRKYLTFCNVCGFIIFTYNEDKKRIGTTKWRRIVSLLFGLFYIPVGIMLMSGVFIIPYRYENVTLSVSAMAVHFNLTYMVLLQRYRCDELLHVLNSFPRILEQVHSMTHRRIAFSKLFVLRSFVRYIPMMLIFLGVLTLTPTFAFASAVIVAKILPDILVEMLHHTVYIALYIVANMYDNLNKALARSRMDKSEKFSQIYLDLYRFSEELNKLLAGYFLLHFFMDFVLVLTLVVLMSLERSTPVSMLLVAASTVNKMRCLMTVADDISERSKFYQKVGVCRIEFHFIQANFQLYASYRIDKKMFLKTIGTLGLYMVVANQYIRCVHK